MEASTHPGQTLVMNVDHVVEWQLAGTDHAGVHAADERATRERIRLLEAQAMTFLRTAVTHRGAAAAQRSLVALDAEIASLRADLAWRRVEEPAA